MRKNRLLGLVGATVFAAALLPAAARADVTEYAFGRYVTYTQTSNSPPVAPAGWYVIALLVSGVSNEVLSAGVTFDVPPVTTYPLSEALPTLHQFNSIVYTDYSQFMLDFPVTTYTFEADRGVGPESGDVFIEEDLYCPEIPHFTGDTFDRMQNIDASVAFSGTINGFTLNPGTTDGSISLIVAEDGALGALWSVSLSPETTQFEFPAGLFQPGTGYSIGLTYVNQLTIPGAGFGGGAASGAEFYRATSATFTTLPATPDPCAPTWTLSSLAGRNYHAMAFDPNRGQVLTFGGGLDTGYRGDTWAWTGDVWRLAATDGPSERGFTAMVHHSARQSVILAGGPANPSDPSETWEWNGSAWTLLSSSGFSPRGFHSMAFDSARNRVVLFGGAVFNGVDFTSLGDTWEWDGTTWAQVATTGPSPRNVHAMAYDPVRGRTVLFGGSEGANYVGDTWEWDGVAWTQVASGGPPARYAHSMVYDPTLHAVVLYGGHNGAALDDVWTWNGAAWTQVLDAAPGNRQYHAMAFDEARGRMMVFGGDNIAGITLGDTWERDGSVWSNVTPPLPSRRVGAGMVYDTARDRTVMFGGSFSPGGVGSTCNNETWEWDGSTWTLRATTGPSARANAPMAYDSARGVIVMAGGWCSTSVRDTWEWDGNTWLLRSTSGPSLRHFSAIAYDEARGKTVLFGGYQVSPGAFVNDTWEWDGATWTQVFVAGPPARNMHSMTYDAARQRVVLFGGRRSGPSVLYGDTWEFDGVSWTQVSPGNPGEPLPRVGHSMVYDGVRAHVLLYGGVDNTGSALAFFGDMWAFDGLAWLQVAATTPPARANPSMAYDSLRDQIVLFGGSEPTPSSEQQDTWVFTGGVIVTEHPEAVAIDVGEAAQFRVTTVGGEAPSFQWRKNGAAIADEPGHVTGTNDRVLIITNALVGDDGAYDCVVTDACGQVISLAATLAVTDVPPPCDGDVNCDFALDGFDVEVQEKAVGGDMTDYCQADPDFNGDFALDGFDVEAVEVVVGGGPCP